MSLGMISGQQLGPSSNKSNTNIYGNYPIETIWRDHYKPSNMEIAINQIIREEMSRPHDLDLDNIQKMLSGNIEERKLAIELLKDHTKYVWKIAEELLIHGTNIENLNWLVRDYYQKNLHNLNIGKEIC